MLKSKIPPGKNITNQDSSHRRRIGQKSRQSSSLLLGGDGLNAAIAVWGLVQIELDDHPFFRSIHSAKILFFESSFFQIFMVPLPNLQPSPNQQRRPLPSLLSDCSSTRLQVITEPTSRLEMARLIGSPPGCTVADPCSELDLDLTFHFKWIWILKKSNPKNYLEKY